MTKDVKSSVVFLYIIYDKTTESFQNFKMYRNDAVAVRALDVLVNSPDDEQGSYSKYLNRYAGDLELLCIGEFDNDTGMVKGYDSHRKVIELDNVVNK